MNSAAEVISSIVYSDRSAEAILEALKPFISLGDSLEDIEQRNNLKFAQDPRFRITGSCQHWISEEVGLSLCTARKFGVINIVRITASMGGVSFCNLKLGEKQLPSFFPYDSEAAQLKDLEVMQAVFRKNRLERERENMPFFTRLWHQITDKD